MNEEVVLRDMNKSIEYVSKLIAPIVESILPGWQLERIEGKENEVCRMLDLSCGMDYLLHSEKSSLVFGLASRVQYGKNYRTFTVRKDRESGVLTEYQKRSQAISLGGLYSYYNMQAYIADDCITGLGITKTADLIEFIKRGYAREKETLSDKVGQASFYVCDWEKMKYCGYKVFEYEKI